MWGLFAVELLLKPRAVGNFPLGAFDLKKKGFVPFIISNHYCTHGWPWRGSTGTSADTHVLPPSAMKKAKKIQSPKEVLLMMSFDHEHLYPRLTSAAQLPPFLSFLSFAMSWKASPPCISEFLPLESVFHQLSLLSIWHGWLLGSVSSSLLY